MAQTPHDDVLAAMMELREIGACMLDAVTQAVTLAPHHLFALLAVADGATSIGALAEATDRHVSSTSRTVDQLVQEGLVERAEDPADRRQVVLQTTTSGAAFVERQTALDRSLMRRVVERLEPDVATVVAEGLRQMAAVGREVVAELDRDPDALADIVATELDRDRATPVDTAVDAARAG